jgi:hypothetical protein
MSPFLLSLAVRRRVGCLVLGIALLTGCGPRGTCDGFVGGTRIQGDIDGDSRLGIYPMIFRPPQEGGHVRGALLRLLYGEGALHLLMEIKLPAEQDTTVLPLVLSEEEWARRQPHEGMVSVWRIQTPEGAPRLSGGTVSVKLADANNLEGRIDARFEDGSRLECTYDIRGQNYVPGDDPTHEGPP